MCESMLIVMGVPFMNKLNSHFDFNHDCGLPPGVTHPSCPPSAHVKPLALCELSNIDSLHGQFGLTRSACEWALGASVPGVSFGSAWRFLFDVPASIGGATLLGASKNGAALRVHPKGYEKFPACIYFRLGATGSSTGSAMNFVNV